MDDNSAILGRAFGLLATGLNRFLTQALDSPNWIDHLQTRDAERGIAGKTYSVSDPQCALRMYTDGIPSVKAKLASALGDDYQRSRAWASELRETRNSWAHNKPLSDRDVTRNLDTIEFLMEAAHQPTMEIRALRPHADSANADTDVEMTLIRVKADEGSVAAMMQLGLHLETNGSQTAANQWYKKSFKAAGEPAATANLAWLYERRNDIPRARTILSGMASSYPLYSNELLGLLAERQGDLKTAETHLRKSLPSETYDANYSKRAKALERVVTKQGRNFHDEEYEAQQREEADAERELQELLAGVQQRQAELERKRRERESTIPFYQKFLDFWF